MNSINPCSNFVVGTTEYSNCEEGVVKRRFQEEQDAAKAQHDADCEKRIKAARKGSLNALIQKYDCKEQIPSHTWESWTSVESWKIWGQSLISLESWQEWATLPNIVNTAVKGAFIGVAIAANQYRNEVNFLFLLAYGL
jgi:hypothetical protein